MMLMSLKTVNDIMISKPRHLCQLINKILWNLAHHIIVTDLLHWVGLVK